LSRYSTAPTGKRHPSHHARARLLLRSLITEHKLYKRALREIIVLEYVFVYHPIADGPSKYIDHYGYMYFKGTYDGGVARVVFKETRYYERNAFPDLVAIEDTATGGSTYLAVRKRHAHMLKETIPLIITNFPLLDLYSVRPAH
jgi:hypothetical protein